MRIEVGYGLEGALTDAQGGRIIDQVMAPRFHEGDFDGGVEAAWPGEERKLVPSPKVATYDLLPEMSAQGVADEIVRAVESDEYDLIIANFANPDMVGHTGVWDATVQACEFLDGRLGEVADAVMAADARSLANGGRS